jgi:site-specific recombinase XerD
VKAFIEDAAPSHQASMSALKGATRKFLSYLAGIELISINPEWNLVNPAPRHRKLLPCFSDQEADAIIDSVNRTTPVGKRDYAIQMIALWTGLRGVDILGLKRSDIDWNRKVIKVVQRKLVWYEICVSKRICQTDPRNAEAQSRNGAFRRGLQ